MPVAASQRRAFPFVSMVSTSRPSGLKRTRWTGPGKVISGVMARPVVASQTMAVPVEVPIISRRPEGSKLTARI